MVIAKTTTMLPSPTLKPNFHKSACFSAGVGDALKQELRAILDIPEANLPVKYLGVPLISTKLRHADCVVLKNWMLKRIQSWSNKQIMFGGRAQLISSVLFSIQVYWSSIFILPHKIVKEIESMLTTFLWKGVEMHSHGMKVAWVSNG
ncbi:hypothetical protein Vadar_016195 [Vaccinium darrowii]|uniref:Uncharacterized protein n=1 Tax=Vaccinium darrowii TaxID=229202 RepID=A0ACB7XAB5_9ERIC|nr:hypothetical protein Vadar_016195 [Vaccinium darrowii]